LNNWIVYTGGTFDILHRGHVNLLRVCKRIAGIHGRVVVGLNTDEFVARYKGNPPVVSYLDRKAVLESCEFVDSVVPNEGDEDSTSSVERSSCAFIVVGSDWACKDYYSQMGFSQKWLDDRNITLLYTPYTEGISTTEIKSNMRSRLKNN